ncbi:hypothetical protein CRENBAI_003695, partial [Crenichthys baileyi]
RRVPYAGPGVWRERENRHLVRVRKGQSSERNHKKIDPFNSDLRIQMLRETLERSRNSAR